MLHASSFIHVLPFSLITEGSAGKQNSEIKVLFEVVAREVSARADSIYIII